MKTIGVFLLKKNSSKFLIKLHENVKVKKVDIQMIILLWSEWCFGLLFVDIWLHFEEINWWPGILCWKKVSKVVKNAYCSLNCFRQSKTNARRLHSPELCILKDKINSMKPLQHSHLTYPIKGVLLLGEAYIISIAWHEY